MRHLLSLAALAVIFLSGCRSCTTMPGPIVGDSMSHWGATENSSQHCQPQTVDFRGALAKLTCGLQSGGAPCGGNNNKYDDFDGPANCGGRVGVGCGYGGNLQNCPAGMACRGPRPGGGMSMLAPIPSPMAGAPMPAGMAGMNGMPCGVGMQPGFGCGGRGCAGLCGGRCAAARHRADGGCGSSDSGTRQLKLPHPMANAHRACAYGTCGARPGPERGSVSFPYYSVRGPRDFLAADPPSIGP